MPDPKPFQLATVDAVCRSFSTASGSRRFLVADEVGLGKTVVARNVIQRMALNRRSGYVVYYITSGQRVANQNRARLIDFLEPAQQNEALSKADRLGLIPLHRRPNTPVALYALTPGTSFPGKNTRLHAGRKEERAFLAALLGRALPRLVRRLPDGTLRANVRSNWDELVAYHRPVAAEVPRNLVRAFRAALMAEFPGQLRKSIPAAAHVETRGRFVGRLRRALAHAVLISRPPDLVVLDEFQRYRDLLSPENRKDRLISSLLEAGGARRPAVLLLSATPYKLYATRWEESQGIESHRELFDLLEFLGGSDGLKLREAASSTFAKFGQTLRGIAARDLAFSDGDRTSKLIVEAQALRDRLRLLLSPFVSRTEREPFLDESAQTVRVPAVLDPSDVRVFRHLATSFSAEDKSYAVPYWLSVPLPAQALGIRYQAWRRGEFRRDGSVGKLTLKARNRLTVPTSWPHPKLRSLRSIFELESLALPWVAPALPWWSLSGPWASCEDQKLLVFSRFKATPQSVAALTSLGVEAKYLSGSTGGYERAWRRRRLQAGPSRLAILGLFHPSPLLIEATDPLLARGSRSVRVVIRRQLLKALGRLGIKIANETAKQRDRHRPLWSVLSALERVGGYSALTERSWRDVAGQDRQLIASVAEWHKVRKLEWVSRRELEDLVTAGLSYPGVVVGRALRRHDAEALRPNRYTKAIASAWHGLRSYLDNPVFWARLPGDGPVKVLPRACYEGGLEAVLDEHFWIRRQNLPAAAQGLADDLRDVLGITSGSFSFHSLGLREQARIRVRCHAAVPFGSTEDEDVARGSRGVERPPRSDEIRKAFNSPFWPHVLATTSVGQEGLDFHTWCRRVAHWDLCPSPLELEQREGRIQRFAGLVVRRRLAQLLNDSIEKLDLPSQASLWEIVEKLANQTLQDASGMSPWWVLKGAAVSRYIFELPQGKDVQKFAMLKEQRLIYRLALGQPNQEDLIEVLAQGGIKLRSVLANLVLNLSAFSDVAKPMSGPILFGAPSGSTVPQQDLVNRMAGDSGLRPTGG